MNVPAEGVDKLPITVIYHPPGVEMVIRSGGGMFKGRINAAHKKMTGHVIRGRRSVGVAIRRAGAPAEALKAGTQKAIPKDNYDLISARTPQAHFIHPRDQRGWFDSQEFRRAVSTFDSPIRLLKDHKQVFACAPL